MESHEIDLAKSAPDIRGYGGNILRSQELCCADFPMLPNSLYDRELTANPSMKGTRWRVLYLGQLQPALIFGEHYPRYRR